MTQADARRRCEELNAALPHGEPPWSISEIEPGDWRPARARILGLPPREPYKAMTEAKPKPAQPDDPRTAFERMVPPYGAAGA